jgi:hypothetical protein
MSNCLGPLDIRISVVSFNAPENSAFTKFTLTLPPTLVGWILP